MVTINALYFLSLTFILISTYDESFAKIAASYSAITHCTQNDTQWWKCKLCNQTQRLQDVVRIQNTVTDILGYIGYSPKQNRIFLAWRKTVDNRNVIQDLTFEKIIYTKCKGCEIHQGFHFAYQSVANKINQLVPQYLKKYTTAGISVTGHSLGAALSTITAIQLQLKYNKVMQLYNFGAPRIGNQNLAQFIQSKIPYIFRIVHNKDYAPHVPFEWLEYHHPAVEVWYDQAFSKYTVCDQSGEDKKCSNQLYPNYSFSDHDVYFYPMDNTVC